MHPEIPEEGLTLQELFKGRGMNIPGILSRLKKTAEELDLPWSGMEKSYNSRLAQEAGKWAEEKGRGEEFYRAVFRAYFAEGANIAKRDVLAELAGRVGLPREEASEVLESRRLGQAVDEDWALSRRSFITAVPTFIMDDRRVVGAQPYSRLDQLLRESGVPEKKQSKGVHDR